MRNGLVGGPLTNGTGRVNGFTNGLPPPPPPPPPPQDRRPLLPPSNLDGVYVVSRRRLQTAFLGILLLLAAPIAAWLLIPETYVPRGIVTDGSSADWARLGVPMYQDRVDTGSPSTTLTGYGHVILEDRLYFAATVDPAGTFFGDDAGYDGAFVFIDSDGDEATGYRLPGLGADHLARAIGTGGLVESVHLLRWSGTDVDDWRNWRRATAEAEAAVSGNFLELGVQMPDFTLAAGFRARVILSDFDGGVAMSSIAFGGDFGALRVEQRTLASVVSGPAAPLLEVRLRAFGEVASISGLDFTATPGALQVLPPDLPTSLRAGDSSTVVVAVNTASQPPGQLLTLGVQGVRGDRPVTLDGGEARAYAVAAPAGKTADGVFEDWSVPAEMLSDPSGDIPDASADLTRWSSHAAGADFQFFVEVRGDLLAGKGVLDAPRKSSGTQQTQQVVVGGEVTGKDFVRVYVDRDPGMATGLGIDGMHADYLLEVSGKWGRVLGGTAFAWAGGGWTVLDDVAFFLDGGRGEGGAALPSPLPPEALVLIETTPWGGPRDLTGETTTRGDSPPAPAATVPPSWPASWTFKTADADEGIGDTTTELLELDAINFFPSGYIYVRLQVEGTSPVLTNNTWWLYLDNAVGDGNNDWLVEEQSGALCSYQWDTTNNDWGVAGGCDVTDTLTDVDIGGAVRVVSGCNGSRGCIDFALEKSDYPGLGQRPFVTGAADAMEDLNLEGDVNRNPVSGGGGCSVAAFDDCTGSVEIPEFGLLPMALFLPAVLLFARRRRSLHRGV